MYCQENGQIYPRFYNQIIWYFSWFLLLNSWYILSIGCIDLAIQPFLVWVTSILYWRDPQYNSLLATVPRYDNLFYNGKLSNYSIGYTYVRNPLLCSFIFRNNILFHQFLLLRKGAMVVRIVPFNVTFGSQCFEYYSGTLFVVDRDEMLKRIFWFCRNCRNKYGEIVTLFIYVRYFSTETDESSVN